MSSLFKLLFSAFQKACNRQSWIFKKLLNTALVSKGENNTKWLQTCIGNFLLVRKSLAFHHTFWETHWLLASPFTNPKTGPKPKPKPKPKQAPDFLRLHCIKSQLGDLLRATMTQVWAREGWDIQWKSGVLPSPHNTTWKQNGFFFFLFPFHLFNSFFFDAVFSSWDLMWCEQLCLLASLRGLLAKNFICV